MLFNKLFVLTVGVFFYTSAMAGESPGVKLQNAEKEIKNLFARNASESEWEVALGNISREILDPETTDHLPNIPKACQCRELGIWSMETKFSGRFAVVWTWLYRVVGGKKWLSLWRFEFALRNGHWYLTDYS